MDHYHIWFNLRNGHKDLAFSQALAALMGHLQREGLVEGYTLARRKLGFGPSSLGEFHVDIRTRDLAQLDAAFQRMAERSGEREALHAAVYGQITDFQAALYRDFPDPQRAA